MGSYQQSISNNGAAVTSYQLNNPTDRLLTDNKARGVEHPWMSLFMTVRRQKQLVRLNILTVQYHVTGVCLPSQSAAKKHNQENNNNNNNNMY